MLLSESDEHEPVNIDKPEEVSKLELAECVLRVTGSASEITFAELPVDDPSDAFPTLRGRSIGSAGRRPSRSSRGCG